MLKSLLDGWRGLRPRAKRPRAPESRAWALLSACPEALLVTTRDGALVFANPEARALLGADDDEALRRFPELLRAPSFEAYWSLRRSCLEEGSAPRSEPGRLDLRVQTRAGERVVELRLRPCPIEGEFLLVHGLTDVTDRRRMEELLLKSRDFYLTLLDAFPGLVWRSGPDGGRSYFNRTWLEFTGRPMDASFGERWLENVAAGDRKPCANACREAVLARRPYEIAYRLRRHDGEYRHIEERAVPLPGPDGALEGYIGVGFDVTESRRNREAEDLARREELQREFVANVSHELRTPVAAIQGFAETLRLGAIEYPKVAAEFVGTIERHAQRLHRLIEDLLEVSSLESGKREARPEPVDLAAFAWDLVKRLAPAAARRKVRLRVAVEPGLTVWMDRVHLDEALRRLCDNAIKFNRKGGSVVIEGRPDGAAALVSVRDTGAGIAPEDLPTLFERFHRKAKPAPEGGTGLGLSIVKGVVELNGGTIWAQSTARGACISFRAPTAPRPAAARPQGESQQPSALH